MGILDIHPYPSFETALTVSPGARVNNETPDTHIYAYAITVLSKIRYILNLQS